MAREKQEKFDKAYVKARQQLYAAAVACADKVREIAENEDHLYERWHIVADVVLMILIDDLAKEDGLQGAHQYGASYREAMFDAEDRMWSYVHRLRARMDARLKIPS